MSLPRVWIVPYLKGWSYDHTAQAMRRHLSHRFEIRIAYAGEIERGELAAWPADLIVDMWWHGTQHYHFGRSVLKQVSSHRWATSEKFGRCSPAKLIERYVEGSGGVVVPSRRLLGMLRAVGSGHEIDLAQKGFEPEQFFDYGIRRGEQLRAGWVGASEAADKHVDILIAAEPSIRLADRCLAYSEMPDFYNSIDIIAIASSDEGDPRPLIEGMASGCFPITTDVGIAPELITHGHNGLIIERTADAFTRALAWCRENPRYIRRAGANNAAVMRDSRTWAHVAPGWGDAFDRAIERSRDLATSPREGIDSVAPA